MSKHKKPSNLKALKRALKKASKKDLKKFIAQLEQKKRRAKSDTIINKDAPATLKEILAARKPAKGANAKEPENVESIKVTNKFDGAPLRPARPAVLVNSKYRDIPYPVTVDTPVKAAKSVKPPYTFNADRFIEIRSAVAPVTNITRQDAKERDITQLWAPGTKHDDDLGRVLMSTGSKRWAPNSSQIPIFAMTNLTYKRAHAFAKLGLPISKESWFVDCDGTGTMVKVYIKMYKINNTGEEQMICAKGLLSMTTGYLEIVSEVLPSDPKYPGSFSGGYPHTDWYVVGLPGFMSLPKSITGILTMPE